MTFELEKATLRAVHGEVRVLESFVRGLPRASFPFEGLDSGPLGGFFIEVPWTLSLPFSCSSRRLQGDSAR